jgi:hypothetical protein
MLHGARTMDTTERQSDRPPAPPLSAHQERAISVSACVDPRTVRRYLAGRRVTSTCSARVEQALRALHLEHLRRR